MTTKEELYDEIVAEAKRDGDIVSEAFYLAFKVDNYTLAVRELGDKRWEYRVHNGARDLVGGVAADVYAAIEAGKEWITHSK